MNPATVAIMRIVEAACAYRDINWDVDMHLAGPVIEQLNEAVDKYRAHLRTVRPGPNDLPPFERTRQ